MYSAPSLPSYGAVCSPRHYCSHWCFSAAGRGRLGGTGPHQMDKWQATLITLLPARLRRLGQRRSLPPKPAPGSPENTAGVLLLPYATCGVRSRSHRGSHLRLQRATWWSAVYFDPMHNYSVSKMKHNFLFGADLAGCGRLERRASPARSLFVFCSYHSRRTAIREQLPTVFYLFSFLLTLRQQEPAEVVSLSLPPPPSSFFGREALDS